RVLARPRLLRPGNAPQRSVILSIRHIPVKGLRPEPPLFQYDRSTTPTTATGMPRALISVSDKTGLADFARGLTSRGFELLSTGGTAKALQQAGLAVVGIPEVTGFPEMMDGRVKTLHPLVHGGILARRARPDDLASAATHGITLIDLVVVNLYPFVKAASNPDTPFDGLVEEIDIGGPSLVRAAAKNFQDVLVVVSPSDYDGVLAQLDRTGGPSREFRFDLARKAF